MTPSLNNGLSDLGCEYPEWKPWLIVIEEVLREAADPKWQEFVPEPADPNNEKVPLLAGATLAMDIGVVHYWVKRLTRAAYQSGAPKMSTLRAAKFSRWNAARLFESSLHQNEQCVRQDAMDLREDTAALQAIATLIPLPFLQACNRRWASTIAESWQEGYCPVCGAWPALAEVRGIERSRYLRCGRCGGGWQAQCLSCPYCGITDHKELVSLVPEKSGSDAVIDACKRCLGYVKAFATLQGSPAAKVMVDDLASVDLDIAALDQGYRRPEGAGYSLDIKIMNKRSLSERILAWRT